MSKSHIIPIKPLSFVSLLSLMQLNRLPPRFNVHIAIMLCTIVSLLGTTGCQRSEFSSKRPNVLFIMLDTLRADHMGIYGYQRSTTPNLDAFARENLMAEFALSAAPWTPTSVASMFTGLYPTAHRMMPPLDRLTSTKLATRLNEGLPVLAETFRAQGYRSAAVSPNPWITEQFGFSRGFDQFFTLNRAVAEKITESGRELIDRWLVQDGPGGKADKDEKPFFLYLHFLDPHDPYTPPGEFAGAFSGTPPSSYFSYDEEMAEKINRYDGEIAYLDSELGKFFDYLKAKGVWEELFIVIVSDHGEQFREHGNVTHGHNLFNEELHVPFFLKTGRKNDKGRRVRETVSTVDIFPTVLDRLGAARPGPLSGVSLFDADGLAQRRGVFSEIRRTYDRKGVTDTVGNRLIMEVPFDKKELDFDDEKGLAAWAAPNFVGVFAAREEYACVKPVESKALQARLRGSFDALRAESLQTRVTQNTTTHEVRNETLEQLKSLGYLQ